ncbi:MAG TPA: uroporphyrinogen-III synthase [Actinomycetota bacterium]|nr:uroporphyrinogen-III synthase [Actinomycetota bacterium]
MTAGSEAPLAGKTIVVTRPAEAGGELSSRLRSLGAAVLEAPTIRIEEPGAGGPLDEAIRDAAAGRFAWVVFTSAAGVAAWFELSRSLGEARPKASLAAVGDGTADALRVNEAAPDLVPERFTTAALGESFPRGSGDVLLARADRAAPDLEDVLRSKGWTPVRVDAYRTHLAESLPDGVRRALDDGGVDAVTFTSASTVEGFVRAAGDVKLPPAVCIGPVTTDAARAAGFDVVAVAEPHTVDGLIDAVRRALE